jgi:hypothetical protein
MLDLLFQTILKKNNTQAKLSPLSETRRYQDRFFFVKIIVNINFFSLPPKPTNLFLSSLLREMVK